MSRAGDCLDNGVAESFFETLKTELIYRYRWVIRSQAEEEIKKYIIQFYNSKRQHSSNGGLSPIEAEHLFYNSINIDGA